MKELDIGINLDVGLIEQIFVRARLVSVPCDSLGSSFMGVSKCLDHFQTSLVECVMSHCQH